MINSNTFGRKIGLLGAAAPFALILGATPAFAQDATPAPQSTTTPAADTAQEESGQDIVVTGSILRQTSSATPSPVTVLTTENLDSRGINTVQDAIQQLSSNNGPALTNSFTANGAFAGGASSVSLRGLSTNSTLVLFDGLRAAYYPLADDGSRNFVDLNTIPDDIVERIEVLRDGASSSYGADAIAGVVNIITKRSFNGVSGRAEAGISQDGVAANQRLTLTAGTGDLDEKGYNAYVSGFFYRSEGVKSADLPAPFNSSDLRGVCANGSAPSAATCGPNNIVNGFDYSGNFPNAGFGIGSTIYVRPYDATNTTQQGRYQILNAAAGCRFGTAYTPTAANLAGSNNASLPTSNVCQQDNQNLFGNVTPDIQRFGGSARFTAKIGDSSEAYLLVNFQQSTSGYTGSPAGFRATANTGINFRRFSTSSAPSAALAPGSGILTFPVYVCPQGVGSVNGLNTGCNAGNGVLNPNNPFAAQNQVARPLGALYDTLTSNETRSRVYRAAFGLNGTMFGDFDYKFDATAMHTDLRLKTTGYVYIQNLLDAIARGTYNFVNPQLNTQAQRDFLSPDNITNDSSDLYQAQFTVGKSLFDLPGGPLQVGAGASIFYEAVDAPSANDDYAGPTQRYFVLNAFGTSGNRTVTSAFGEIVAPIVDQFELSGSGRYDHYSSGQSNFSPKVGFKFTPVRQLLVRGTYSKGFRIPSFGEANALPTTGFVSQSVANIPANFLAQYAGCTPSTPAACPTYVTAYSIGLTTLASPNLKPEKSRSFTAGILFEPIRNVSFTVDYYNIKKTGAITSPSNAAAIAAYYAGTPIPAGFNVVPDAADINLPNGKPRIGFVESALINANTIKSEGIDFGIQSQFDIGSVKWSSNLDASLTLELSTKFPDGTKESYVDTLGNFNLTAGSGTYRWRGNWRNTFDFGDVALTGTANYTSGYDLSAEDQTGPGTAGDCGLAEAYSPSCRVKSYFTFDANVTFKVNDKFSFYVNTLNVFNRLPAVDVVTYGAYLYNPVQAGNGILGRMFRAGAKFGF